MDVSVIIPVYNTENYLNACVDSILQQAAVSLEIILADDGSTDASPKICDNYAQKYENVHAVHIQNSGPATAKNESLKLAQQSLRNSPEYSAPDYWAGFILLDALN